MKTNDFIEKTDFDELNNQKDTLLKLLNHLKLTEIDRNNLEGLLHLIDSIQDYAVDVMGMNEDDVFKL